MNNDWSGYRRKRFWPCFHRKDFGEHLLNQTSWSRHIKCKPRVTYSGPVDVRTQIFAIWCPTVADRRLIKWLRSRHILCETMQFFLYDLKYVCSVNIKVQRTSVCTELRSIFFFHATSISIHSVVCCAAAVLFRKERRRGTDNECPHKRLFISHTFHTFATRGNVPLLIHTCLSSWRHNGYSIHFTVFNFFFPLAMEHLTQ